MHLFHAIRADLLRRLGRLPEAAAAYAAAITHAGNARERAFLERQSASGKLSVMSGLPANVLRRAARLLPACCCVLVFPVALHAQEQTTSAPHAGHAMASPAPPPGQAGTTKPGELPAAIAKPIPLMPKSARHLHPEDLVG